jgi:hypothetical protein
MTQIAATRVCPGRNVGVPKKRKRLGIALARKG